MAVTGFAVLSQDKSIYEMVGNAYKITLVAAFVPLVVGLYWKRLTTQGALLSALGGLLSWSLLELFAPPRSGRRNWSAYYSAWMGTLAPQWGRQPASTQLMSD